MGRKRRGEVEVEFDGHLYWYVKRYDPANDLCCLCREVIPDEDVPLILFKERGSQTLMCRLHWEPCGAHLLAAGHLKVQVPWVKRPAE